MRPLSLPPKQHVGRKQIFVFGGSLRGKVALPSTRVLARPGRFLSERQANLNLDLNF